MSEEKEASSTDGDEKRNAESSVKKGAAGVLLLILVSLTWYLAADRYTPYTQQARIQGFVVGVAPKVSGLVTSVHVKNNQIIEAGETLFEIDRSSYEITLKRARSDLDNTRKQVSASAASVETARANLRAARANEIRAEKDATRQERLYQDDEGTISLRRLEMARASYEQAKAKVTAAESEVQRAIEQMGGEGESNAKLKAAESAVEQAELDLSNTTVLASTDGVITDLRAEVGQYAAAGNPVMTLIAIDDIWIMADFTENNLGHMRVGTPVEVVIDSMPGEVFSGSVRSIGLGVSAGQPPPPGSLPTIQNNRDWLRQAQRYPVMVEFDEGELERLRQNIRIGGQAEVIAYSEESHILKLIGKFFIRVMSWFSYAY
ncbi:MAG: HlyD family secretion protein [Gammaproteobacteria bacterium]|jgi:multidrug resistance efflux pump